jgi:hypothetical protein
MSLAPSYSRDPRRGANLTVLTNASRAALCGGVQTREARGISGAPVCGNVPRRWIVVGALTVADEPHE